MPNVNWVVDEEEEEGRRVGQRNSISKELKNK